MATKAQVLFNNDNPLLVLVDPTPKQMEDVIREYKERELQQAQTAYGKDTEYGRTQAHDHMSRCYFHYHEVDLRMLNEVTA